MAHVPPSATTACLVSLVCALLVAAPVPPAQAAWPANGLFLTSGGPDGGRIAPELEVLSDGTDAFLAVGRGHEFGGLFRVNSMGDAVPGWFPANIVAGGPVLDGQGGLLDFFTAPFAIPRHVYFTRYDASGSLAPGWTAAGSLICGESGSQAPLLAISDGAGGGHVAWQDGRSGSTTTTDLYLQRVLADGSSDPSHPGGVRVGTIAQSAWVTHHQWTLTRDDAGGVFVSWLAGGVLRVQHLGGDLVPRWPGEGTALAASGGLGEYQRIVADGSGGAYAAWSDGAGCHVIHLGDDGAPSPGWPSGGVVLPGGGGATECVSDGAGGVIVAWQSDVETRASRFGPSGASAEWPAAGVVVGAGPFPSVLGRLACAPDGFGGAFVALSLPGELRVHRVTARGELPASWPAGGVVLRTSSYTPFVLRLGALGPGDAVALWAERWPAGGSFHEDRVYAQRVGAAAPVSVEPPRPNGLALGLAGPVPSVARLTLTCTLPRAGPARVRVLDVTGRVRAEASLMGAGARRVDVPESGSLRPGVYLVELRQGEARRTLKATVVR